MLSAQLADRRPKLRLLQAPVICSTENRFLFTTKPPSFRLDFAAELSSQLVQFYRGPSQRTIDSYKNNMGAPERPSPSFESIWKDLINKIGDWLGGDQMIVIESCVNPDDCMAWLLKPARVQQDVLDPEVFLTRPASG